jgi:predicted DNA-binding transcriptional regulator YafY
LSAAEATALLIAAVTAGPMPYADAASAAARRLLDALPEPTRVQIDELRGRIRTTLADTTGPSPRVKAVVEEAVRTSGVVRLVYVDADGVETRRDVEAVGFHGGTEGWYLVGWCRLRRAGRVFRLDRIRRATATAERVPARDVDEVLGWVPFAVTTPA